MRTTKHRLRDTVVSSVVFCGLLLVLASYDERLRDRLSRLAYGEGVTSWGEHAVDLGGVLFTAVRHQSIEHAPLVTFALVGAVLFIFMFRT